MMLSKSANRSQTTLLEYDLKLSRRQELIKSSRVISRVNKLKLADVSGTISVPILRASEA
jgi:hypothetical protein